MRERNCTVCLVVDRRVPAKFVAATKGPLPLEWFECGAHEPTDNGVGERRVTLTPVAEWLAARGLKP